jgi:hypothetical protein
VYPALSKPYFILCDLGSTKSRAVASKVVKMARKYLSWFVHLYQVMLYKAEEKKSNEEKLPEKII